jgi:hypothetical protein
LPKSVDERLAEIRIVGSAEPRLSEELRRAKVKARHRLEELVASKPDEPASVATELNVAEASILADTRRAIVKARPDKQGVRIDCQNGPSD